MKRRWKVILSFFVMSMLLMLAGCGSKADSNTVVRVGSLKGPTSIGLVSLMKQNEDGTSSGNYEFTMEVAPDTLVASMVQGNLDIALVPANVASVVYGKTEGGISVIDINTLGVLYIVGLKDSITDISDLSGKTLYLTGKGTTPDFVLQYVLSMNDIGDVDIQYKSEATEVVAALSNDENAYGLLPQPFATVASVQNENLGIIINMNDEWDKLQADAGSRMVTGVTIVRNEFLEAHPEEVATFLSEHRASVDATNANIDDTANLVEYYGIIEKAPIAAKAIPFCNIVYIDGEEMKVALSGYLNVLYGYDASFIGGALPEEDFYYIGK